MHQIPIANTASRIKASALGSALLLACGASLSQTQLVKAPPVQYWMDVATISMAGMDDMPDMGGMSGLIGSMTGMPGMGGISFGASRGMMPGRWLDLAVRTQFKPAGTEAVQAIPRTQAMGPSLILLPVSAQVQGGQQQTERGSVDAVPERPKGRILFYWGCSESVRAGQPRVLDFAKSGVEEYGKFMMGRATRDTGAQAIAGHAVWPNEVHRQRVPPAASLVGQHAVTGEGLPASLQFTLGAQQDFMPKLALTSQGGGTSATRLGWQSLPTARAYFLTAMSGSDSSGETEMVIWSSSEVPEPGWGLLDYASPANLEKWLAEKVLLTASKTECAVPAGIFAKSQGAMLRGIAYGQELNLAHPPRPVDKRIPWEPEWAAKVRVKSISMVMLGEQNGNSSASQGRRSQAEPSAPQEVVKPALPAMPGLPDIGKALKGLFNN